MEAGTGGLPSAQPPHEESQGEAMGGSTQDTNDSRYCLSSVPLTNLIKVFNCYISGMGPLTFVSPFSSNAWCSTSLPPVRGQ